MREVLKQRLAALLCGAYEAGRVSAEVGLSEQEAMGAERDAAWLDAFAQEHREIYEDPNEETEHDWPVWEKQAEHVLRLLTNNPG